MNYKKPDGISCVSGVSDGVHGLPDVIAFDYDKACELLAGRGYRIIAHLTRPPVPAGRRVPFAPGDPAAHSAQSYPGGRKLRVVRERLIGPGEVELILAEQ